MSRLLALLFLLSLPAHAEAAKRVALIIGNDTYAEVDPLQKAVADAEAVAGKMQAAGYETILRTNADRRSTNLAISRFTSVLVPGDIALIFYAGHGVQIDGENYLLPTDIAAPSGVSEGYVTAESIPLSDLLERVRRTGARTTVAIVDACRDNPFEARNGRTIGGTRGLARIAAPEGTFVMFSAGAGQQALDRLSDGDPDRNSVFTRALLPKLEQDGLELRDMIFQLREEVRDLALSRNHQQFPAYYDELLGDFFIKPAASERATPQVIQSTPEPAASNIRADFDLARSIGTQEAYSRFIATYQSHPDQFVVDIARDMLASLGGAAIPQPAPLQPSTVPAESSPRAIMRETQSELNRVGCNAGGADGIAGRRTKSAFASFIGASGAPLTAGDLGSAKALATLKAATGTICKPVSRTASATTTAQSTTPTSGPTLTGTWRFSAKCPLFIRTTGTARFRHSGGNRYAGSFNDSIGQHGQISATMNGRSFAFDVATPTATATEQGVISADGSSYSSQNSFGCKIRGTRVP